jgi:hypothetical protein
VNVRKLVVVSGADGNEPVKISVRGSIGLRPVHVQIDSEDDPSNEVEEFSSSRYERSRKSFNVDSMSALLPQSMRVSQARMLLRSVDEPILLEL